MISRKRILFSLAMVAFLFMPALAPVASAQNVCVHRNGLLAFQSGLANCNSAAGQDDGNRLTAVGNGNLMYTANGANDNSGVVVGDGNLTEFIDGSNGNRAVAFGDENNLEFDEGAQNGSSIAIGDENDIDTDGSSNTSALAIGVNKD
jgi:hypothetical protein